MHSSEWEPAGARASNRGNAPPARTTRTVHGTYALRAPGKGKACQVARACEGGGGAPRGRAARTA